MKKISVLIMLFISITILINCQENVVKNVTDINEKTVTIYLSSTKVEINGIVQNRLIMFDSNGNSAIDSLTTIIKKIRGQKAKVIWEALSGIEKITKISAEADTSIIFADGVKTVNQGKKYKLKLPLNRPLPGEDIKEAYYIYYIPSDESDTVKIDPFIRIPPPEK
jgi:hypothetical protein